MIHAEISIYPMGTDTTSASIYIAKGIEAIQGLQEIRYQITPMGTILESVNIEKIFDASRRIIDAVHRMDVKRVVAILKIDYRTDKKSTLEGKIESVNKYLSSK